MPGGVEIDERSSASRSSRPTAADTLSYRDMQSLARNFVDGDRSADERRVLHVFGSTDFGVLMAGSVYRMTVPVKISGVRAAPCRYRSSIEHRDEGSEVVNLRVGDGGAGKALPGIVATVMVECEALTPGQFVAKLKIVSEGGITFHSITGTVLEQGTYRTFARSKFQVSGSYMLKPSVHRVGRVNPEPCGPRVLAETESVNSLLSGLGRSTSDLADPHLNPGSKGLPPCPTVDAVLRILGEEEREDLSQLPSMPGMYWDRATQELKMDSEVLHMWHVDLNRPLQDVVAMTNRVVDERSSRLEKKGLVTDRVLGRLRDAHTATYQSNTKNGQASGCLIEEAEEE